jgi:hypothetical protein
MEDRRPYCSQRGRRGRNTVHSDWCGPTNKHGAIWLVALRESSGASAPRGALHRHLPGRADAIGDRPDHLAIVLTWIWSQPVDMSSRYILVPSLLSPSPGWALSLPADWSRCLRRLPLPRPLAPYRVDALGCVPLRSVEICRQRTWCFTYLLNDRLSEFDSVSHPRLAFLSPAHAGLLFPPTPGCAGRFPGPQDSDVPDRPGSSECAPAVPARVDRCHG